MSSRRERAEEMRHLMDTEGEAIGGNTQLINELTAENVGSFDRYEELREEARGIKEDAIENLPDLIDQLEAAVSANGGHLHVAQDAEDANRIIEEVLEERDAETLVKSKSMTTEEIGLNEALEAADVDVWETDLGEFVIQIAEETPSHLVGPSLHRSREEITELFEDAFDVRPLL